ncbi:hypothetical protein OE88DRAFT_210217 [Heliocybe sulcata]|uniref:Uncharacterized protein n=1 Tax=Heliocybe sulcata TaxID=5364 RepID=A0A5C3N207_9AGAM|nr:hypothetical protein OE88DRAFT_210217 [Heliocybe sulcata]
MSTASQFKVLLFLEAGLYGTYAVLFSASLVYAGRKVLQSRVHATLIALIVFLFISTSINFAINTYSTLKFLIHDIAYDSTTGELSQRKMQGFLRMVHTCIFGVNITLADGLLVWRCAVLWCYKRTVVVYSIILMTVEVGLGIAVLETEALAHQIALQAVWPNPLSPEYYRESAVVDGVNKAYYICMLLLNLSMTVGISRRIWHMAASIPESSRRSARYSRIAHIILESGVLYAVLVIIVMLTSLVTACGPLAKNASEVLLYYTVAVIPTVVTILVTTAKSTENVSEAADTVGTQLVFALGPRDSMTEDADLEPWSKTSVHDSKAPIV